ncbi:MAG: C1 family peptidase [Bacteroidales bacterium]|nr:C1 family peptidase [Bacteroidales bacterium]MCQ2316679.1 C1 family peptidase [Bacteroidales bacterium]
MMKNLKIRLSMAAAVLLAFSSFAYAQSDETSVYQFVDDVEVKHTIVQNQGSSGTCWCYAGTGFVEAEMLRKYGVELNLSEMFFDRWAYKAKFEKYVRMHGEAANISCGGEVIDVLHALTEDGMVPNEDYTGWALGEERNNHWEMHALINEYAKVVIARKNGKLLPYVYPKMVDEILNVYLGEVPETFEYEGVKYDAKSFAAKYPLDINDYVQLGAFTHKELYKPFNIHIPDNWTATMTYNMTMDELMAELDNALNSGYTAGWAQDVSDKGFSRKAGVGVVLTDDISKIRESNPKAYKKMTDGEIRESIYKFETVMPEIDAVDDEMHQKAYDDWSTGDDHSMLIVGIAHDQNGTKYYKVKNSWGEAGPFKGYWYCSEKFVRLHTIFFTVNKESVSNDMAKKLGF